jgi:leucyl-tRNA synthetase family protein
MQAYDPKKIEEKWNKKWLDEKVFKAADDSTKPKYYQLETFPYPSAAGLHMGHPKGYTAEDIHARYMRMHGYEVLYTMGWDAFGLPTENYAIKVGRNPHEVAHENTDNFRRQVQMFGFSYDWDREIDTSSPEYYKWTQWLFIQLYKRGLAYRKDAKVNWCPKDQTVLANEQVIDGKCERCGSEIEERMMEQWFLKITDYANRLLEDLKDLDWPAATIKRQEDWIGKSEGAELEFGLNRSAIAMDLVFATNNKAKLSRMQKLFNAAGFSITLKTPTDIGVTDFDVIENGKTLAENAEKKARVLAEKTKFPVLADDTGFFIDGAELDPVTVKRNALQGVDEKDLTIDEISDRIIEFYKDIADHRGGKVDAEWRNALCLITPERVVAHEEAMRPSILSDELHGKIDPYFPLRGLYISKTTGKYVLEQTEEEEMRELQPITDAIKRLFMPSIKVFTTRPDTLFGATYLVLAPEHALIDQLKPQIKNWDEVEKYREETSHKTDRMRQEEVKNKTGVELKGVRAVNPANKEEISVWIADYVLGSYGTGAIMAVPAHDERDFEFAKKFGLPIKKVVVPKPIIPGVPAVGAAMGGASPELRAEEELWEEAGDLINSGEFTGMDSKKAKAEIVKFAGGTMKTQYKLRDWSVSRQRYWGVPIPMVHCPKCGIVPVPESELPVVLPDLENYRPQGMPPLASSPSFINVKCPQCGGADAKRDAETLDTFVDSSWYFLRYSDPHNAAAIFDKTKVEHWMPVDLYVIGAEHTVMHLLYSRFITKFLHDEGYVSFTEPFKKMRHIGLIMGADGQKMSKSKGNVVNPDEIVAEFSADVMRMYLMFLGPFYEATPWDAKGILGVERFLKRFWKYCNDASATPTASAEKPSARVALHRTIKKVGEDIEAFKFNTAISALMILLNELEASAPLAREELSSFVKIVHPFVPHMAQELWSLMGNASYLDFESWPVYDLALIAQEKIAIVFQVNGKMKDMVSVDATIDEAAAKAMALASEKVKVAIAAAGDNAQRTAAPTPKRIIYVDKKLVNIVI